VSLTRRQFLETAALAAGALAAGAAGAAEIPAGPRLAMCDWNLGRTGQVAALEVAASVGLDGVEASVSFPGPGQQLRDPAVRRDYRAAANRYRVKIPSLALGILNEVPLASEPKAALWLADSIEAARLLGARVILLAFFGRGELRMADAQQMGRLVDLLRELAPRAAAAGVILGLENTLSAQDNLELVRRVASPAVRTYYDCKNSADQGRDPAQEIRALGPYLCQVHLKNGDRLLEEESNVDFPACAQALRDIGYRGWYVLETASPRGLAPDTQANIAYVRRHFPPAL